MFTLKKVTSDGKMEAYAAGEDYYAQISATGKDAVDSRKTLEKYEESLLGKKKEYNKAMMRTEENSSDNSPNPLGAKALSALTAEEGSDNK